MLSEMKSVLINHGIEECGKVASLDEANNKVSKAEEEQVGSPGLLASAALHSIAIAKRRKRQPQWIFCTSLRKGLYVVG